VDKSEAACRQIVSRAKERLAQRKPRFSADASQAEGVVRQFLAACASGDTAGLLSILTEDATLLADGGGRVSAVGRPIRSADHVSRFFVGIRDRVPAGIEYRLVTVNQRPGVLALLDGVVTDVFSFDIEDGRIRTIYVVRNPEKLAHVSAN
jgi:RNA polymerase sigma-70 factor (ECF subfamily)